MRFVDYPDRDQLYLDLAGILAGELKSALDHQDRALFIVPGGTTPGPVFDLLSAIHLDWPRVDVTLSDERWVPEDHTRSNTRLLKERLLIGPAAQANLISLYDGAKQPEDSVTRLETSLNEHLPPAVLLLGMGADMHTASLFPGSDGLSHALSRDAGTLVAMRPADQEEARISFSARVLNGALSKHLIITGDEKRAALNRAKGLNALNAPINSVMDDMTVHWAK
ncbi:MAG: 6-phosphogluconolactonase [Pseudomonadota bacterium]